MVIAALGCAAAVQRAHCADDHSRAGLIAAPGYLWAEVLLKRLGSVFERVMIGTGLALMLPIFGGLVLYAVGISLRRDAARPVAGGTIVGAVVLAIMRRKSEPAEPADPGRRRSKAKAANPHALIYGAAAVLAVATIVIAVISSDNQSQPGYTQLWMAPSKNAAVASLGVTISRAAPWCTDSSC